MLTRYRDPRRDVPNGQLRQFIREQRVKPSELRTYSIVTVEESIVPRMKINK